MKLILLQKQSTKSDATTATYVPFTNSGFVLHHFLKEQKKNQLSSFYIDFFRFIKGTMKME